MINQSLQKVIYNEQNANSIWSIYEQNRKKMQKDVGDRFKKLRQVVKKAEEVINKKLEELMGIMESNIKDVLKMDPMIQGQYKNWEDKSFGLILKTEECSLQDKMKNLHDYNNTRLVPQGQAILDKMR